jgi:Flp pilus assembly protein TadG
MNKVYGFPRRQRGVAVVEFAIVGAIAIMMIFAVLEISRAIFVTNALTEATRRGARMAAVCPINDPAIAQVATFTAPGAGNASPFIRNLDTTDFVLEYLDRNGTAIGDPTANFNLIRYVQLRVTNFEHELLIPFANVTFTMPEFATRLPRESLGVPRSGVVTPC